MDVIGWSVFLGLVVLLLPMLPVLVILWLLLKLLTAIDRARPGGPPSIEE